MKLKNGYEIACAVFGKKQTTVVLKRPNQKDLAGLWQFEGEHAKDIDYIAGVINKKIDEARRDDGIQ